MAPVPVTVAEARHRAAALYERRAATWATASAVDDGPLLDLPLHPPSERDALADQAGAVDWVGWWRGVPGVVWGTRQWASLGRQDVPERLTLHRPADVARFAGTSAHWTRLSTRCAEMVDRWGDEVRPVLRRHARTIHQVDEIDLHRLHAVVTWLVEHPDSGLYLRQIPVEGVSTKWAEAHRSLLVGLVTAMTGRPGLGLLDPPSLVRLRFLDTALAPGGLRDLAAPARELAGLAVAGARVLVVENLQTLLALPDASGVIAVHGSGYAVDRLGEIGWIRDRPVDYWGDLDRDGFAILDRLRAHCPDVRSLLMDAETLLDHRHLWTPDPTDGQAVLGRLTGEERAVVALLADHGGVRLEQERLRWDWCLERLGL